MGLLRSETMKKGTLVVPNERARAVLHELGSRTKIQFEDMNARTLRRAYKTAVQRIEECERIVRFLTEQVERHEGSEEESAAICNAEEYLETRPHYRFEEIEAELKRAYAQLKNARDNHSGIIDQHSRVLEEKYVVIVAAAQTGYGRGPESERADAATPGVSSAAGVIGRAEQDRFARALFRMSRGNTFTSFHPISDPIPDETGKPTLRSVFVVYFQGGATSTMNEKVKSVCTAYGGRLYNWPTTAPEADQRFQELNSQLADSKASQDAYDRFVGIEMAHMLACPREGGNSLIEDWRMFLTVEKSIYTTLNHFEATEHTLKCDCWYADNDEDHIRRVLIDESPPYGVSAMLLPGRSFEFADPHGHDNPPTYIKSSGLTKIVQEIIDTYGTPRYKEANPMPLSLVTFPFIFGVMFGDIGHGLLLFLVGCFLCLKGNKLLSIPTYGQTIYDARYLIVCMGFFATYAGFLYNDFLSLGLDLFGSRYKEGVVNAHGEVEWVPNFDQYNTGGAGPYPFGLDPAWHGASNQLLFVNSMKMKIAVLLGVTQMIVGTMLSFSNAVHDKSKVDFAFVCVPQIIFMVLFFGYMDFLIIYKWTHVGPAPSIINTMIAMGLGTGLTPDQELFAGQDSFQQLNLFLLMACVPWMLIPKPACLYYQNAQRMNGGYQQVNGHDDDEQSMHGRDSKDKLAEHDNFDFADVCIHQVIETIEFVLGSISHTASYLRLWALSLAHNQLSLVFFQKTLLIAFSIESALAPVYIFLACAMFIGISCLILMGMDVLECFLHTLRLHWVEFQSKFYHADGHKFSPYSHKKVLMPEA